MKVDGISGLADENRRDVVLDVETSGMGRPVQSRIALVMSQISDFRDLSRGCDTINRPPIPGFRRW